MKSPELERAADLAQAARWFQDGRCTSCGDKLADELLAEGWELCGGSTCCATGSW